MNENNNSKDASGINSKSSNSNTPLTPPDDKPQINRTNIFVLAFTVVLLLFIYPIGLIFLWFLTRLSKKVKIILSLVMLIIFFLTIGYLRKFLISPQTTLTNTQNAVDISKMQIIGSRYSSYHTDGKDIYCDFGGVIRDVNLAVFKVLDNTYATDDKTVYYACLPISGSNPNSFKLLASCYSLDKNQVYSGPQVVSGADPETFEDLGICYGKDKSYIYLNGKRIEGADVSSFKHDGGTYGHDKNTIYYFDKPISGTDPASFVFMGYEYIRDRNAIYYQGIPIEGSDPNTASYIGAYVKDKTGIYNNGKRILTVDMETAQYLGYLYFNDKENVYYDGKILPNADARTFKVLAEKPETVDTYYSTVYAKDIESVYYGTSVVQGADPATFAVADEYNIRGRDKNSRFYKGKVETVSNKQSSNNITQLQVISDCQPLSLGLELPSNVAALFLQEIAKRGYEAIVRKSSIDDRAYFDVVTNQLPDSGAPYNLWIVYPNEKGKICGGVSLGKMIKDPNVGVWTISFSDYDYRDDANVILITSGNLDTPDTMLSSMDDSHVVLRGFFGQTDYVSESNNPN